jgi:hypothetical protein
MKKLIIKLLNKIIDSIRKDINKQEDNTNLEDILKFINKNKENKRKDFRELGNASFYDK